MDERKLALSHSSRIGSPGDGAPEAGGVHGGEMVLPYPHSLREVSRGVPGARA